MNAIVYYDFHMFFFFWIVIVLTTLNAEILEWDNDAKNTSNRTSNSSYLTANC